MPGNLLTALAAMRVPLAAGALGGLLVATMHLAGPLAMPLMFVALVPTFAVGLSKGQVPMLYALGAATVVTGLLGQFELALKYVVGFAAPQAWLVRQALLTRSAPEGAQWYPAGRLVAWLVGIAAAFVVAATVAFAGAEGGLVGSIERYLEQVFGALSEVPGWRMDQADAAALVPALAVMLPGVMAVMWALMMVINGALAQALAARTGGNLRPSAPFAELTLPAGLMYALGIALVASLLPGTAGFLGKTLVSVVTVAYLLLGLAVIHAGARRLAARRLVLSATYFMIVVLQWLAVVVIVLGLAEQVFGLRKRYLGPTTGREIE